MVRSWEDTESKKELEESIEPEYEWGLDGGLVGWTLTQWGGVICPNGNWGWRPRILHEKHLGVQWCQYNDDSKD